MPVSGLAHALQVMLGVCAAAALIHAGADPKTDAGRHTLEGLPRHGLVTAWWLSWLASLLLDRAAARTITAVSSVDDLQTGAVLTAGSAALLIAAAVCAITIIGRITAFQRQRSAEVSTLASGPWPVTP